MIISLSKKVEGRQRHVVLLCEPEEMREAAPVVAAVLEGKARPERKYNQNTKRFRYLFHTRFLDDLLLAFPLATKSTGLQRRLDRLNTLSLEERQVEPFEIPGLWDRKLDVPAVPFKFQYISIADTVRYLSGEMDHEDPNDTSRFIIEHFLNNDEMGLGKTLVALCSLLMLRRIMEKNLKLLVIAPKNGKFVWEEQNLRWANINYNLIDADIQAPHQRDMLIRERADITIVNPEMLRGKEFFNIRTRTDDFEAKHPDLFNFEYDIAIIDEYHRFGSPDSQQTKGLLRIKAKKYLPMSGTPYLTRPTQLWPILHLCWPERYPDYSSFKSAIEITEAKSGGKVVGYRPAFTRPLKEFIEPRSIRRRKDQVLADLPPAFPIDIPVELNREQRKLYNKIRDEFMLLLDSGEQLPIIAVMTQVLRLKQACFSPELYGGSKHSAKIDELRAYVESLVASNDKAIIGSEWAKAARILQREFKDFNPAYVDGTVKGAERMRQAAIFNNDPDCHLYIGTIGANREAVSLGSATTVIFTDKDWSPMVNDQFAGRSAAGGIRGIDAEVDRVSIVTLYGKDTYEEAVEKVLKMRKANFNAIVEKDGGNQVQASIYENIRNLI